jgi:CHAT domain-containing protein
MNVKIFIWRSISICCLTIAIATTGSIWHQLGVVANPAANTSVENLNPSSKAQPLNGQNLQRALDRQNFVDAIRQVELGWQYQYESYYQGKFTSQYLELAEIQQQIAKIDSRVERLRQRQTQTRSALLYAVPRPDGLHLILVPASGAPIHKKVTAANAKTLPQAVTNLRLNISNSQTTSAEYLPPAQQIDRWLIQPVAAELKANKIDTILFCLGAGLRGLPLAALHDGRQFLVERYNLAIIPAFNLVDRQLTALPGNQVLAMGAATFTNNTNLPAVPLELETITQKELWSGKVLLNQQFTLKQFQQARSQNPYGIVHLATHADISAKSVRDSYIQFWDRRLRLNEVRNLHLDRPPVQLLVLSACRTALGAPNAELGFAGLAVQSGAKAVVASLWSVDDVGTLVLMADFYQQLKIAPLKSQALRNTQLAMLKENLTFSNSSIARRARGNLPAELQNFQDRGFSHPYYWAAFTTIGNPW